VGSGHVGGLLGYAGSEKVMGRARQDAKGDKSQWCGRSDRGRSWPGSGSHVGELVVPEVEAVHAGWRARGPPVRPDLERRSLVPSSADLPPFRVAAIKPKRSGG